MSVQLTINQSVLINASTFTSRDNDSAALVVGLLIKQSSRVIVTLLRNTAAFILLLTSRCHRPHPFDVENSAYCARLPSAGTSLSVVTVGCLLELISKSHQEQCVSKNIPDIFSCNSRKHCRIFI